MEHFPSIEDKGIEFKSKIEKAVSAAFSSEEYEGKIKMLRIYRRAQEESGLSTEELLAYEKLLKEIQNIEIIVPNLSEYKKLLEVAGLNSTAVNQILSHENAHANVAEQLPSQKFHGYKLRFSREGEEIIMHPSAVTSNNSEFSRDQQIQEEIWVTKAPKYYGEELSESDQRTIKELHKKLRK